MKLDAVTLRPNSVNKLTSKEKVLREEERTFNLTRVRPDAVMEDLAQQVSSHR